MGSQHRHVHGLPLVACTDTSTRPAETPHSSSWMFTANTHMPAPTSSVVACSDTASRAARTTAAPALWLKRANTHVPTRTSSVVACSDTASLAVPLAMKRFISGSRPTVDTMILARDSSRPVARIWGEVAIANNVNSQHTVKNAHMYVMVDTMILLQDSYRPVARIWGWWQACSED